MRRWRLSTMQNAGEFQPQIQPQTISRIPPQRAAAGTRVLEMERSVPALPGGFRAAGVSAAWRKLLLQAEIAAPHVQIASIEGESGVGKQTLARYLLSRSPLAESGFQRRDAREWLLGEGDLTAATGFAYLDRVDLLAAPGQGL